MRLGPLATMRRVSRAEGALVDAVNGEAEAHEEEQRQEPRGEHGRIGQMNLIRAARRHEVIDGGDAHHIKEAATERVAVRPFAGLVMEAALGQRFVTDGAVAYASVRKFLTAKRTLSVAHAPLDGPRALERAGYDLCSN